MSDGSIRERLAMLSRGELLALVAVLIVTLGGAALWYTRSLPRPVEIRATVAPQVGPGASSTGVSATPSAAPLIVDVAGAVRKPGVYQFQEGDRVVDAIQAAGGPTGKASLEALNLAAPLTDGVQILVPGAAPAGAPPPPGAVGSGPATLININTASATELEALPGIGEVIAQRIVDYRTQNGPFTSVDGLLDVSGIGDAILGDIHDLVTV
ncbi:MAG: helix-hairpin-helix domain-containing protein [Actinomycetota bacterium]